MLGGICNSPHGCLAGCGLSTSSSALDTKKLAGENSCKAGRLRSNSTCWLIWFMVLVEPTHSDVTPLPLAVALFPAPPS
ncbi:hypothetical protein V6N11_080241 [Hibiscus sabdariffa]|uniref:Uncharacterized protein n=1 Tax=Hibiscus sabdariffa TaxID=183260 RepID=A0ABR2R741_9ROSI